MKILRSSFVISCLLIACVFSLNAQSSPPEARDVQFQNQPLKTAKETHASRLIKETRATLDALYAKTTKLEVQEISFRDVCGFLSNDLGYNIILRQDIDAEEIVTLELEASAKTILDSFADQYGLRWSINGKTIYIDSEGNDSRPSPLTLAYSIYDIIAAMAEQQAELEKIVQSTGLDNNDFEIESDSDEVIERLTDFVVQTMDAAVQNSLECYDAVNYSRAGIVVVTTSAHDHVLVTDALANLRYELGN